MAEGMPVTACEMGCKEVIRGVEKLLEELVEMETESEKIEE